VAEGVLQFQLQKNVFQFEEMTEYMFEQSCSLDWFLHSARSLDQGHSAKDGFVICRGEENLRIHLEDVHTSHGSNARFAAICRDPNTLLKIPHQARIKRHLQVEAWQKPHICEWIAFLATLTRLGRSS
jgi:hypothetical protein